MANPVNGKHNVKALIKEIRKAAEQVAELKEQRTAINEQIGAIRADVAAKGVPKKAFDQACAYVAMDEDKREGFDAAYQITREALGQPVQGDMFQQAGASDE